jgi:hypothetical protein
MRMKDVRVAGDFDDSTATWVVEQIARAAGGRVLIDLRGARELHDTAIAALGVALRPGVSVIGLTRHHEQLLRYLATVGRRDAADVPPLTST